jgi:hypothetical protein
MASVPPKVAKIFVGIIVQVAKRPTSRQGCRNKKPGKNLFIPNGK